MRYLGMTQWSDKVKRRGGGETMSIHIRENAISSLTREKMKK